ncbi:MAG: flagellar hook-basal body complex protein [Gammaproteobacteria bacterium]|jgi:flagellar hook protein FlgE|nr:flagellar hook-basal body complex protein [Gammaproteobacteria bacterium]
MTLNSALSGLKATSNELSVVSNNIANVSTTGFKESRAEFADIYANSAFGVAGSAIGSGVVLASVSQQFSQGQIEFTNNNLDLSISGQGFFILSNNGAISFTRAGAFGVDKNGFIVNNLDHRLQGYLADNSGNITGAQGDLRLSNANLPPLATSAVNVNVNFDATAVPPTTAFTAGFTPAMPPDPTSFNTSTSTTIYDSLGNSHVITSYFVKAHEQNTWRVYVGIDGIDVTPAAAPTPAGPPPVQYPSGELPAPYTIVFDTSGSYVANNPINHPTYYGPGPVVSTSPGLVTSGTLSTLSLNDLNINGVPIAASSITSDIVSTTDNAASAISIVAAINQNTQLHGATATINPTVLNLGVPAFGNFVAGDFTINSAQIIGASANPAQLMGLINAQTPTTGVIATQPGGAGTDIILTANDGRNIQVMTTGTTASGADFTNFDINGGVALNEVERGTVNLATTNNQAIIIAGNNPNSAGFVAGPQAGIVQTSSDLINIPSWLPTGGAAGPQPVAIDFSSSTQYGAPFSVLALNQNGYSTGRLSGVDIDSSGIILAKYSNGQSLALGEVALANFGNVQGLSPVGNTTWVDTFASGTALIGEPGTADLGVIQSGALEGANVELTDELVKLILAQRNFQANAQSIKTADAITQTIINIR